MSKYRNIKVHVPTPEISEAVQEKLIEDGCKRHENKEIPANTEFTYIYVYADGTLSYAMSSEVYAFLNDEQEVPYQSILDPYYDVKIAWANGEAVQYRALAMDGNGKLRLDGWKDWKNKEGISLSSGEEWRIKPKTKTIKQWEYKKTILEGEEVYTVVFRHKALAMDSYRDCGTAIAEPTLVEYEVPNE